MSQPSPRSKRRIAKQNFAQNVAKAKTRQSAKGKSLPSQQLFRFFRRHLKRLPQLQALIARMYIEKLEETLQVKAPKLAQRVAKIMQLKEMDEDKKDRDSEPPHKDDDDEHFWQPLPTSKNTYVFDHHVAKASRTMLERAFTALTMLEAEPKWIPTWAPTWVAQWERCLADPSSNKYFAISVQHAIKNALHKFPLLTRREFLGDVVASFTVKAHDFQAGIGEIQGNLEYLRTTDAPDYQKRIWQCRFLLCRFPSLYRGYRPEYRAYDFAIRFEEKIVDNWRNILEKNINNEIANTADAQLRKMPEGKFKDDFRKGWRAIFDRHLFSEVEHLSEIKHWPMNLDYIRDLLPYAFPRRIGFHPGLHEALGETAKAIDGVWRKIVKSRMFGDWQKQRIGAWKQKHEATE